MDERAASDELQKTMKEYILKSNTQIALLQELVSKKDEEIALLKDIISQKDVEISHLKISSRADKAKGFSLGALTGGAVATLLLSLF